MFKELTIDHFRGIQKLELTNLSKVNLIVGTNGSGKSTLLDSFFLTTNPLNTRLITNTNILRGVNRIDENFFSTFFYGLKNDYDINFHASLEDGSERNLKIKPYFDSDKYVDYSNEIEFGELAEGLNPDSTQEIDHIPGVILEYTNSKFNEVLKSKIKKADDGLKIEQPNDLREEFGAVYLSVNNIYQGVPKRLEKIIVDKNLDYVIKALNIIEDSITDLSLGNNGMIYCDLEYSRLLPLKIMGDGFQRLLAILLAMYDAKKGIILVDEIENGIFHSKFPAVWETIYKYAQEFNVQVFATTHSIECIEHFSKISLDSELFQSEADLNLYRVEEKAEHHKVTLYNRELLRKSLEKGFEIR
ncbi:MAG TPA: AAA family ATPase [Balneolaceae bacterium]|nr:AAA family ATPase [Balneolaceae bacterium]